MGWQKEIRGKNESKKKKEGCLHYDLHFRQLLTRDEKAHATSGLLIKRTIQRQKRCWKKSEF